MDIFYLRKWLICVLIVVLTIFTNHSKRKILVKRMIIGKKMTKNINHVTSFTSESQISKNSKLAGHFLPVKMVDLPTQEIILHTWMAFPFYSDRMHIWPSSLQFWTSMTLWFTKILPLKSFQMDSNLQWGWFWRLIARPLRPFVKSTLRIVEDPSGWKSQDVDYF